MVGHVNDRTLMLLFYVTQYSLSANNDFIVKERERWSYLFLYFSQLTKHTQIDAIHNNICMGNCLFIFYMIENAWNKMTRSRIYNINIWSKYNNIFNY